METQPDDTKKPARLDSVTLMQKSQVVQEKARLLLDECVEVTANLFGGSPKDSPGADSPPSAGNFGHIECDLTTIEGVLDKVSEFLKRL